MLTALLLPPTPFFRPSYDPDFDCAFWSVSTGIRYRLKQTTDVTIKKQNPIS